MGDVIKLQNVTRLDLPPEDVLEAALKQEFDGVVVLGLQSDGEEYFASSLGDVGTVLWLVERFKKQLLEVETHAR